MKRGYDEIGEPRLDKEKPVEFVVRRENCVALKNPPAMPEVWKKLNRPPEFAFNGGRIFDGTPEMATKLKQLGFPGVEKLQKGEMVVFYPKGDYFLSLAVAVHDMGYLLQEKFNSRLSHLDTFATRVIGDNKTYRAVELGASQRGWDLIEKYCPEKIGEIEGKFRRFRRQGKLREFDSFKEMYDFALNGRLHENVINAISSTQDWTAAEKESGQDKQWYRLMKQNGVDIDFEHLDKMRIDEEIDEELVQDIFVAIGNGMLMDLKNK